MTFLRTWMLFVALLPALWVALRWRVTQPRLPLILKALALIAIIVALAEPEVQVDETKLAVAVLVDTSASLTDADLARSSELASAIERSRGRNWVRVLPFARGLREPDAAEFAGGWRLRRTAGENGRVTDLEGAIRDSLGALPEGMVPRLVLISDGRETRGSIARAAHQARSLGVPIDTYSVNGRPEPKLRLTSVQLPAVAFTGERFPVDITLESPAASKGTVTIAAEGKMLGQSNVSLAQGENQIRVTASIAAAGAIDISGSVKTADLGEINFEQAVNLRRPRLLYLSQDAGGMEKHIFGTLSSAQFDVVSDVDFAKAKFEDYQIVMFNNWDLESIPPTRKSELEAFVQEGGGLLVVGGERNTYVEKPKDAPLDPLNRTLPATLAPPRSPEGTVVVLIMDKSSSMEGRKMELARVAAIGVIDNLRTIDTVGVLIFDNSFQWAVPPRRAEDKTLIKRLVAGITPDGGTQIAPALAEGFKRILTTNGVYRHIVLLTDGISEEGDSMTVSKEASLNKVTISTVGLGQDVNKPYLEKIALNARGKAYFLTDPSGLEKILLKDVMEHTGTTTVEKPIQARVEKQVEILEGVPMDSAPPLKGYVRFEAKPTAETILSVDVRDPLLSRWQYGLGRAAVFASDAKSRWAEAWVSWPGFDRFWANLVRDLLPHAQPGEADLSYDAANGQLIAEYRLARHVAEPPKPPQIFAFGPDGFQAPMPLEKLGAGVYRGKLNVGARQGLFRVRPLETSRAFPEVGLYRPELEMTLYGANRPLMKQVAEYTGGRFQPEPRDVFQNNGRSIPSKLPLWPAALAFAIALNLAELFIRRGSTLWAGLRSLFGGRRTATA